jgi:hypothetical protein
MVSGYENPIEFKLKIYKTGKHTLQFKFTIGMYYSCMEVNGSFPLHLLPYYSPYFGLC